MRALLIEPTEFLVSILFVDPFLVILTWILLWESRKTYDALTLVFYRRVVCYPLSSIFIWFCKVFYFIMFSTSLFINNCCSNCRHLGKFSQLFYTIEVKSRFYWDFGVSSTVFVSAAMSENTVTLPPSTLEVDPISLSFFRFSITNLGFYSLCFEVCLVMVYFSEITTLSFLESLLPTLICICLFFIDPWTSWLTICILLPSMIIFKIWFL